VTFSTPQRRGNTLVAAFQLPCKHAPAIYNYLAPGVIDVCIGPASGIFPISPEGDGEDAALDVLLGCDSKDMETSVADDRGQRHTLHGFTR
jgi:hypothetical protein